MLNLHSLICLVCCLFALLQTVFFVFWKQHCMTPHNFHNNARWDYILKTLHFSTFSPWFKSQEWVPHWQNNEFGTCRGAAAGVEKGKYPGARTRFCCQMPKATTAMSCSEKRCYYQHIAPMLQELQGFLFCSLSLRKKKRRTCNILFLMMCYLHSNNQSWLHNFPVTESTLINAWEESKRIIISWLYQIVFVGCDDTKDGDVGSR